MSAALARRAPKPQDRALASALIRQHMAACLHAYIREEEPPRAPEGYEAALEFVAGEDAVLDIEAVRAELKASLRRMAERADAERQRLCRDLEGWAATLNALAEQIVVPHERQEPVHAVDDAKVVPIAAAPSRRGEEPLSLISLTDAGGGGFVDEHPDNRRWMEAQEKRLSRQRRDPSWRRSPWRLE